MGDGLVKHMKHLLALFIVALPLAAQTTVNDSFVIQADAIKAIKLGLEANYLEAADTNDDGAVSNAEAIAWYSARRQEVADTFQRRAIDVAVSAYRADQTLTTLPAGTRALLDALIEAEAAWQAEYDRLVNGPQ